MRTGHPIVEKHNLMFVATTTIAQPLIRREA
jgi:hypothetical protein